VVSINVAQLLQTAPGTVRELECSEPIPDPADDLHLRGPVRVRARLTHTSPGILAHVEHAAPVLLECARCLAEVELEVEGAFDEEFLPLVDVRTGLPVHEPRALPEEEQSHIDEHHEINLDESLRQNILTSLPMHPLCEALCPGLCPECGERLDAQHRAHAEPPPEAAETPFARLAELLSAEDRNGNP
jgi:uncharacterized protein